MLINGRTEYKYYIPSYHRTELVNDIIHYCDLDPHGSQSNGEYAISSIYFDDWKWSAYHEKIEGQSSRKKLRLRVYEDVDQEFVHLEIKSKLVDATGKWRFEVPANWVADLLSNKVPETFLDYSDDRSFRASLMSIRSNLVKPTVQIDYTRQAFYSRTDSQLRVTLDSNILCRRSCQDDGAAPWLPTIPSHLSVLEIKTPGYFPDYLCQMVAKFGLTRRAISKYALSVQSMGCNDAFTHV